MKLKTGLHGLLLAIRKRFNRNEIRDNSTHHREQKYIAIALLLLWVLVFLLINHKYLTSPKW